MSTPRNRIPVPKPPADAFNKHRPVSKLLTSQMEHMSEAVKRHLDEAAKAAKTEGEAAEFIRKMSGVLRSLTTEEY